MTVSLQIRYKIEITPDEFNLLNRALRGALRSEEREAAEELSREMAEGKVKQFEMYHHEVEKLKRNLENGGDS